MIFFWMLKKNLWENIRFKKKKDVSFWRFIAAPKRKLAPNIIDKQLNFFFFDIRMCLYLTNKWTAEIQEHWYLSQIEKNLISGQDIWNCKKKGSYILIRRISPKKWYPPNTGCYLPSRHHALLRPCPVATYQVGTTLFFSSCPKVPLSLALHDDHHGHSYCASLQLRHRLSSSSCLPWCRKPRKLLGVVCRRMCCQAWLL